MLVFCMVHFCCLTCLPFGCPVYRDVSNTELPAGNTWVVIWPRENGIHQYSSLEVVFKSFSIIIFFTAFRIGNIAFRVLGVELKIGLFLRYFWNDRVKIWKWLFRLWRWIWILCCSFVGRKCGVKDRVWAYRILLLEFVFPRSASIIECFAHRYLNFNYFRVRNLLYLDISTARAHPQ